MPPVGTSFPDQVPSWANALSRVPVPPVAVQPVNVVSKYGLLLRMTEAAPAIRRHRSTLETAGWEPTAAGLVTATEIHPDAGTGVAAVVGAGGGM